MRVANVPALRGKEVEQAQTEAVGMVPSIEHQPAGAGEASSTLADESDVASPPTGSGEKAARAHRMPPAYVRR